MQDVYKHFMGEDGFVWFTGVVEDRNDPDALGRVRVRCVGFHTEDLNDIPTADLPWRPCHASSDRSIHARFRTHTIFSRRGKLGNRFFLDAKEKQQPMIIGSLPGIPQDPPDPTKGFNDPRSPFSEQPDYAGTPTYGPYPVG